MRDNVAAIEDAERRPVFHHGRDVTSEVNDQSAGDILVTDLRVARRDILRQWLEILSQLLRIRPGNETALPTQRIHHEVRAVGARSSLRSGIGAVAQFAAAKKIGQPKLLADHGAKTVAGKASNLDGRRLPNMTIDPNSRLQTNGATGRFPVEEFPDGIN